MALTPSFVDSRHPEYLAAFQDWDKWRLAWEGGTQFRNRYLEHLSTRETDADFVRRKKMSPVPSFAKAAITDIKNAVYQRMRDIVRKGGTASYQSAIRGLNGGVDNRSGSMNHFIGDEILPELLIMGRVGVFVDNIAPSGPTIAHATERNHPFLYMYAIEDILSWTYGKPEDESEFQAVLLRDYAASFVSPIPGLQLPDGRTERFRLLWIDPVDKYVRYQFYNEGGAPINADGLELATEQPVRLDLKKIPFHVFQIEASLMEAIADHQIALLNLLSTDISYAMQSNFPFYTEMQDGRAGSDYLKGATNDGTSGTVGDQTSSERSIAVGATQGRTYGAGMERPDFIHPSPEPLKVSMALRQQLEDEIRKLVNLAVVQLGSSRASGEARAHDNQGLEGGLSYIGLVLENGEQRIAEYWAEYESKDSKALVLKYPERYSLIPEGDRLLHAEKLTDLAFAIPSKTAKDELNKDAAYTLLGNRVSLEKMETIYKEIEGNKFATSDPEIIRMAKELYLASAETLSNALGFDGAKEIPIARKERAEEVHDIAEAQTEGQIEGGGGDAAPGSNGGLGEGSAARGNPEGDTDPNSGKKERAAINNDPTRVGPKPTRGKGNKVK